MTGFVSVGVDWLIQGFLGFLFSASCLLIHLSFIIEACKWISLQREDPFVVVWFEIVSTVLLSRRPVPVCSGGSTESCSGDDLLVVKTTVCSMRCVSPPLLWFRHVLLPLTLMLRVVSLFGFNLGFVCNLGIWASFSFSLVSPFLGFLFSVWVLFNKFQMEKIKKISK